MPTYLNKVATGKYYFSKVSASALTHILIACKQRGYETQSYVRFVYHHPMQHRDYRSISSSRRHPLWHSRILFLPRLTLPGSPSVALRRSTKQKSSDVWSRHILTNFLTGQRRCDLRLTRMSSWSLGQLVDLDVISFRIYFEIRP